MARRLSTSERAEREYQRILQSLRNEVKRELERDAQKLLGDVRQQLVNELQRAFSSSLRQEAASNGIGGLPSVSSLTRIVSTVLRLTQRPHTSTSSVETTRSQQAFDQFRLSRGQTMADMSAELNKGERNL